MAKLRIKEKYLKRCSNYLQWLPEQGDETLRIFKVDHSIPEIGDGEFAAVEAMFVSETHGKEVQCNQPYLLDCLKKGKASREFHVKGWLSMTRTGEMAPEEFFGCLGLRSAEEFQSIFGRSLTLPRLRIIHQVLEQQIKTYESMYIHSGSSAILLAAT